MNLTRTQEGLLCALRAALRQETLELSFSEEEWEAFFQLAHGQSVLPIVFEAVRKSTAAQAYPALFADCKKMVIGLVARQIAQSADHAALYQQLRADGFHPIVFKGQLCNRLYPLRDYRTSGDDDLFIHPGEFYRCHKALLSCGLTTETAEEPLDTGYEVSYRNKTGTLYIELHHALFDTAADAPDAFNDFFDDAFDSAVEIDGFLSLTPHLHMLYLILHACKHFMYSGFGIRQVCDIGLWARTYGEQIDYPLLLEQCKAAHADVFAAALFAIVEKHLGFALNLPPCWDRPEIDTEPLLADMFDGGVHGSGSLTRLHSSTVTLNAIKANRTGTKSSVLSSVFPSRQYMSGHYPYLRKYPFLLPAAWVSRICHYVAELQNRQNNNAADTLKLAKKRIQLLEHYGIIHTKDS